MKNIQVEQSGAENTAQILRKYAQRMRGSGIVQYLRDRRYRTRALSEATVKKQALKRIARMAEREKLIKEGKISEKPARGARR